MIVISKYSGGIIISFMEVCAIFCTRMDFTKLFVMSLDFADVKNNENVSCHGNDIQDALKGTATLMISVFYMKDLNKTINFDTSFI